MGILVITTGGTIGALPYDDEAHPPSCPTMPSDGSDIVRDTLSQPHFNQGDLSFLSMPPRDSKHIDDEYRKVILDQIDQSPQTGILLTNGTDRLLTSADYFYRHLKNKTMIVTAAMVPLSHGPSSDGYMNLAFALAQLRGDALQPGVYIVLCDYHDDKSWQPRLYRHEPSVYEKLYVADGRYNRIRRIES